MGPRVHEFMEEGDCLQSRALKSEEFPASQCLNKPLGYTGTAEYQLALEDASMQSATTYMELESIMLNAVNQEKGRPTRLLL